MFVHDSVEFVRMSFICVYVYVYVCVRVCVYVYVCVCVCVCLFRIARYRSIRRSWTQWKGNEEEEEMIHTRANIAPLPLPCELLFDNVTKPINEKDHNEPTHV